MAEEITWSAKTYCDCGGSNWFFFDEEKTKTSTSGTSANSFTIYIDKATSPNDCSNGYVGVSSTTIDGEIEETIIPVNRCLPSCECGKDIIFSSGIRDKNYDASGKTGEETIGTWEGTCDNKLVDYIVGGDIFSSVTIDRDNRIIKAYIPENTTYDKKYDFFRFTVNGRTCYRGQISQSAKVNPCYSSTTVSIDITSIDDETCKGTSGTCSLTGEASECWFIKKAKVTPNDLATVNIISYDSSEIIVLPNPASERREGTCVLTMQNPTNGLEIQSSITITQAACEAPASCSDVIWVGDDECIICNCSADDFELVASSIEVPIEGYDDVIGSVNVCIDKTNMTITESSPTPWGVVLNYNDNDIYLTVPANENVARNETISIAYSATCGSDEDVWEKEISLSQEGSEPVVGCSCDGFVFQGEDEGNDTYKYEISAGGTSGTLLAKVNEGCKVIAYAPGTPTGDFNDIASAGCGGGLIFDGSTTLKINAVMNASSSAREGTMPVTYKVSGETGITDFCTKTIHLVQAAGGPSSSLSVYLKVTGNMYNTRKSNMATIKVNGISVDLRYSTQQGTFENVYAAVAGDAATRLNEILCGTISRDDGDAILTDESTSTTYRGKVTSTTNLYSMANIVINITQS